MKKMKIAGVCLLAFVLMVNACNTKKDCRGRTKHRLSNGIWM
ncbi:MAG: hypothetical protein U0T84_05020 [Chitinophagales bacterium]